MFWIQQKFRSCITLLVAITTGSITAIASFFGKAPWYFIVAVSMASVLTVLVIGTGWQDYHHHHSMPSSFRDQTEATEAM
jgi:hypothetical protein